MKDKISTWLKKYAEEHDMESFVVGVSGGIDSAVSSTLAANGLTIPIPVTTTLFIITCAFS